VRVMLVAIAAAAALALAGAAAADQTYTDGAGEVAGSADISTVAVSNNPTTGTLTFGVTTNYTAAFDDNTLFGILMDTDNNASTGLGGFDYLLAVSNQGAVAIATATLSGHAEAQSSVANGVWTITVPVADVGSPTSLNFGVITQLGPDPNNPIEDVAPDSGIWTYQMVASPPPPPPPPPPPAKVTIDSVTAVYAGVPKHGVSFRITKLDVDLSNGVEVKATSVKCSAAVGGAHVAGTGAGGCTLHLPTTSKGKQLVVKVTGHYKAKAVSNTIHLTVK
jgi:hypothetical protein